jgi:hypothetical protein
MYLHESASSCKRNSYQNKIGFYCISSTRHKIGPRVVNFYPLQGAVVPGISRTLNKIVREDKNGQKHTTGGIPRWSPTLVLVARFSAYVWQSGRDAQFSLTYGRMCLIEHDEHSCRLIIIVPFLPLAILASIPAIRPSTA